MNPFLDIPGIVAHCQDAVPISNVVCRLAGVDVGKVYGHDRHAPIARARHVAIWAIRERLKLSYPRLGEMFAGRDHRTVMHSCKQVRRALESGDGALADLARRVDAALAEAG